MHLSFEVAEEPTIVDEKNLSDPAGVFGILGGVSGILIDFLRFLLKR